MNRLVLALLALFAGLAAQVSTAQARACNASETEIGAVQGVRGAGRASSSQTVRNDAPAAQPDRKTRSQSKVLRNGLPLRFPTIYLGVDRARE